MKHKRVWVTLVALAVCFAFMTTAYAATEITGDILIDGLTDTEYFLSDNKIANITITTASPISIDGGGYTLTGSITMTAANASLALEDITIQPAAAYTGVDAVKFSNGGTLTGTGAVSLTGGYGNDNSGGEGVYASDGNLTINGALTANGGNTGGDYGGSAVYTRNGSVTVNGVLTAHGGGGGSIGGSGVATYNGNITVNGTVNATGGSGGTTSGGAVTAMRNLIVSSTGTVTASTTESYYAVVAEMLEVDGSLTAVGGKGIGLSRNVPHVISGNGTITSTGTNGAGIEAYDGNDLDINMAGANSALNVTGTTAGIEMQEAGATVTVTNAPATLTLTATDANGKAIVAPGGITGLADYDGGRTYTNSAAPPPPPSPTTDTADTAPLPPIVILNAVNPAITAITAAPTANGATLAVTTTGGYAQTYQWQAQTGTDPVTGKPIWADIPGATSATFDWTGLTPGKSYTARCVVTNSGGGQAISEPVMFTIPSASAAKQGEAPAPQTFVCKVRKLYNRSGADTGFGIVGDTRRGESIRGVLLDNDWVQFELNGQDAYASAGEGKYLAQKP